MSAEAGPTYRHAWSAAALTDTLPPRYSHPNKQLVHDLACPPGSEAAGTVTVSRWPALPWPDRVPDAAPTLAEQPGYFTYDPPPVGVIAWHQNFADPHLFGFYAGALFAQDEMQVAEHPALASVRAALLAAGVPARTDEGGRPTPVLVAGVERRCAVDTEPTLEAGRIEGLYGNRFGRAAPAVIRAATRRIDPPTVSNILAIAAMQGLSGRLYTADDLSRTLATAYAGYRAAVRESELLAPGAKVAIHTGFWGCGAFGGDRVLMTVLQALAARLAGVDTLVLHLGDTTGARSVTEARRVLEAVALPGATVAAVLDRLLARRFVWGASDGN